MTNWSGNVHFSPRWSVAPRDEGEIADALEWAADRSAGVRVIGAGHSYNEQARTDDLLVDLSRCSGQVSVDAAGGTVSAGGGVPLARVTQALDAAGLTLRTAPDIDVPTVAGAIATGSHGTGIHHPSLSGEVTGLRLVAADGSVLDCSQDTRPDLLAAASVSLGALGVITRVTLRCVPAFSLGIDETRMSLDRVLPQLDELVAGNERLHLVVDPIGGDALVRTMNPVADRPARHARVLPAHQAYLQVIPQRVYSTEYAVPSERGASALRAMIDVLRRAPVDGPAHPIVVRWGAAESGWLSTSHGRATCHLTGFASLGVDFEPGFRRIQAALDEHDARPHWGKLHYARAGGLRERYPRWADFAKLRRELDPQGRFGNPYLDRVLGPVAVPISR